MHNLLGGERADIKVIIKHVLKKEDAAHLPSLEERLPKIYIEFFDIKKKMGKHYASMQDMELTIEDGCLWMLRRLTPAFEHKQLIDSQQEVLFSC